MTKPIRLENSQAFITMRVTFMKWIRNCFVANLLVFFPMLWVVVGWMPDQVKVQWRGELGPDYAPAIVTGESLLHGEFAGTWTEGEVCRFYLRSDMAWKDLAFRLPPGTGADNCRRIDLQKWKVFRLSKNGSGLVPVEGRENTWHFERAGFDSAGFASMEVFWGLFALECLLLGVSWLFARCHHEESWKTLGAPAVFVALALAFLTEVAVPLQSYWANQSAYPFPCSTLAGAIAIRFSWMFAVGAIGDGLLARCFGRWVLGVVLAFATCVYLESGILSVGLPSLNGDWWFFHNGVRAAWDAVVWGMVFVLLAAFHSVLEKRYGLVALCLLAMIVASMMDVRREENADASRLVVHDFSPIEMVVRSTTYSSNRNVMIFVLDSLDRELAHAIMEDPEAGPELKEQFRGFTEFIGNVGAWSTSLPAVANMLTGRNPESAAGLADYFASPYSSDSVLTDYLDAGFSVFLDTGALGYGYASPRTIDSPRKRGGGVLNIRLAGDLGWTLGEVARFRCWPFGAKAAVAQLTDMGIPERKDWGEEQVVYPALASGNVDGRTSGSFVFCHTKGVHGPVIRNRRGDCLARPDDSFTGRMEAGIWALRQLGRLFDAMREKGVYDNSLILVLADHGPHKSEPGREGDLPANGRPFLWVKAQGSAHDFIADDAATHHGRISGLLKAACHQNLTERAIREELQSEQRIYRLMSGYGGEIGVWSVARNGDCTMWTEMLDDSELEPLELGRVYGLGREQITRDRADIEFRHCGFWPSPVWLPEQPEMELRFRVPDSRRTYHVRLALKMTNQMQKNESGASVRFVQKEHDGTSTEVMADYRTSVLIRGVRPNEKGLITITGYRNPGMASNIYFLEFTVMANP